MVLSLAGCNGPTTAGAVDGLSPDAAEGAASAAVIVLERTVTADDSARASAVARFIKMRAGSVDQATLRMVGATLELPPLGSCASASDLSAPTATDPVDEGPRAVELLDVGAVAVEANDVRTMLEARALPDIVDLVTGVLYSTSTPLHAVDAPDALPSRGRYVVRSSGLSGGITGGVARGTIPPFAVVAVAPGEPDALAIDGQDARAESGVALKLGAPVELSWTASETSDPEDRVYVEVLAASRSTSSAAAGDTRGDANVRCLFADNGSASIPASAFVLDGAVSGVTDGSHELTQGTLVVHRVHREAFQVGSASKPPIDSGVLRFDFARAADFTRR